MLELAKSINTDSKQTNQEIQDINGKFFKDGERLASHSQVNLILDKGGFAKFGETRFWDVPEILEKLENSQQKKNSNELDKITKSKNISKNYIDAEYTKEQISEFPDY